MANKKRTTEQKVADAMLQNVQNITIAGKEYEVAPPSVATLIMMSAEVSKMPAVKIDDKQLVTETLALAQDCGAIGNIVAIMIMGAKAVKEDPKAYARLARQILEEITPNELFSLLQRLFKGLQIDFFYAATTSLITINLTKATKTETTQFGQ